VRVCNFDGRARGDVLVQEVLSQSLNVGATFVAEKLGADRFATYVRAFGLGEETGIDVPNEVPGRLSGLSTQSAVDLASASFGQGIALTPIAMTRALSALGNGGMLPEPHVVQSVRYTTGITKQMWHPATKRVISEEASNTITGMLIKVVDTALSHGADSQKHYTIAAKTGTAQMASPGGGYYSDRYLHSFFGYFPARNPRFIVFLFAVEPRGVEFASQSLTEPFMDMTKFLLNYYDVPPDR
jgi:cell division protein FtsI/penicillin-binding protein 2